MTTFQPAPNKLSRIFTLLKQALKGGEHDFTSGSIRRAVLLLAIPMMLEMVMESVFALVDQFFVGHLPNSRFAVQTVGLTESVLAIIYSIAVGLSMAATAVVARRIGEQDADGASRAGMQTISIALFVSVIIGIVGFYYAPQILSIMGAAPESIRLGTTFTRVMMGESIIIVFLFLINGVFRGAGNAAIAMRSLWIANMANIILCPIMIYGADLFKVFGFNGAVIINTLGISSFKGFGLTGAAIATTLGRGSGVVYQLYHLFSGKNTIKGRLTYLKPHWEQIKGILKIALPGIVQFLIQSGSFIFLAGIVAVVGGATGSAGYQTSLRFLIFFLLPAWGMSNAAATLVGQNLGAKQFERAEESVFKTMRYNVMYMALVTIVSFAASNYLAAFFTNDESVRHIASLSLRIMSTGYVFYGIAMVMMSAFNGAGDTWATTKLNFAGFWVFQVTLAYLLSRTFKWGATGVFVAIPISYVFISLASYWLFKRGNWKRIKV